MSFKNLLKQFFPMPAKSAYNQNQVLISKMEAMEQNNALLLNKAAKEEVFCNGDFVNVMYNRHILDYHKAKHGTYVNVNDEKLVSSICRPTDLLRYIKWVRKLYPPPPRLFS